MFNFEFNFKFTQLDLAIVISLFTHLLVLIVFDPSLFGLLSQEDEKAYYEIDMNMEQKDNKRQSIKTYSKGGFITEDAQLYVFRKILKKEKSIINPMDALLADIAKYDTTEAVMMKNHMLKKKRKEQVAMNSKNIPSHDEFLDDIENSKSKNSNSLSYKKVRSIVNKHYDQFRSCYEKVLLSDELISGNLTVTMNPNKDSKVVFKGIGQKNNITKLKSCINIVAKKIKFPSKIEGRLIKFSLFFKS
jgi:hypothetical protein